jgi:hypothetical protein
MNLLVACLYVVISVFFARNLGKIYAKIKSGKIANKYSLLAASSLVFQFISLAVHFLTEGVGLVVASQLYMIACMTFLLLKKD